MSWLFRWLDERVPGGARWAYVFGSALVFLLLAQFASGIALAFTYSASVPAAWASVARIESSALGHLVRGLHAQGATFLLAVAGLHLLQTALFGAYRAPRQGTWWLGLVLLVLLLAFCLTGSLLPWDERGYWATRVSVGIAAGTPLIGGALRSFATGGSEFGNLTLTRFYAVHATVLPLLLLVFAAVHVAAMRRHGVTPPPRADLSRSEPFWPRQALYDASFALLLISALFVAASVAGAPLQGPADPGGAANPRPEWYFRPLFEVLKIFPARLESLGALGLPLLTTAFLFALPWIDKDARRRPLVLATLAGGLLAAAALCLVSYRSDAKAPDFARAEAEARLRARKALRLARTVGVPPEGALAMLENQPDERGRKLFARICVECHTVGGQGGIKAPRLDGYLSRRWIRGMLVHPDSNAYYGNARISGMESYAELGDDALDKLTDFLYQLRSRAPEDPALDAGRRVFERANCADCHSFQRGDDNGGPSLWHYGSREWLTGMVTDPGAPGYYPEQNHMPDFGNRLPAQDIHDLVAFLISLEQDETFAQETP